jgi:transcription elongation factor GreA
MSTVPPDDREPGLTADGRQRLAEWEAELEVEVARLRDVVRGSAYDLDAKEAYVRASEQLDSVRGVLRRAASIDDVPDDPGIVLVGDVVVIRLHDGEEETYRITHAIEAGRDDDCISAESPLATALLGRRVGEDVVVDVPRAGSYRCTIVRSSRA